MDTSNYSLLPHTNCHTCKSDVRREEGRGGGREGVGEGGGGGREGGGEEGVDGVSLSERVS